MGLGAPLKAITDGQSKGLPLPHRCGEYHFS